MLTWNHFTRSPSGGGRHVSELAAALQRQGHEVHVFTRRAPGQSAHDCVYGVHYHRCQYVAHSDFVETSTTCAGLSWTGSSRWRISSALRPGPCPRLAGGQRDDLDQEGPGPRCIFTVHSTEYGRSGNAFLGGAPCVSAPRSGRHLLADHVIAVSNATKKEIEWMYEVPGGRSRPLQRRQPAPIRRGD